MTRTARPARHTMAAAVPLSLMAVALLSACGSGNAIEADTTPGTALVSSAVVPVDPATPAPLSAETLRRIKQHGTTASTVDAAKTPPAVSQQKATDAAVAEFAFLHGRKPAEAGLTRATNASYGQDVTQADGSKKFQPVIADRLTWLVIFRGVNIPIYGGHGKAIPQKLNQDTFMVVVDATTGEYLRGESVVDDGPDEKAPTPKK